MGIRLLGNRVMLKQLEADTTSGGILLPETAQEKPQRAEIIAVGEGEKLDAGEMVAPPVKAGDVVVYARYGGSEITMDGEDYLVMDADQIYAVEG
jgi:chaperonin GroES